VPAPFLIRIIEMAWPYRRVALIAPLIHDGVGQREGIDVAFPYSARVASSWLRVLPLCLVLSACATGGILATDAAPETMPATEPRASLAAGSVETAPARKSFLGIFRRRAEVPTVADPVASVAAKPTPSMSDAEIAALGPAPDELAAPSRKPRLLGFLFKRTLRETTAAAPVRDTPTEPTAETKAMLDGETGPLPTEAAPPKRRFALFGRRNATQGSIVVHPPVRGVVSDLPFGEIVTVCDVPKSEMGKEVARSHGAGKYRLLDTDPTSEGLRPQFLTGFKDGCARQFSAALALFGSASVHEATRYNPLNESPYSRSDIAYEKLKDRICGVRRGVHCPENRVARLDREVAFVSVYKGFGDNGQWLEIILNKGKVVTLENHGL
jgi:hypothetical protein